MDEHADWQKLEFEFLEKIPDKLMGGPFGKRSAARKMLMEPFDVTGYEKQKGGGRKKASKKKTKKKVAKKKRRSRMS